MAAILNTAARVGCVIRELARMQYRDGIQHGTNLEAMRFMTMPASIITHEVANLLQAKLTDNEAEARTILENVASKFKLDAILERVSAYNNLPPERIILREIKDRISNLPAKTITVMGGDKILDSRSSDAAYELGKKLAEAGVVAVCDKTTGMLTPFLRGMSDQKGLTVGILSEEQVRVHRDHISETSGLIKLPVVTPYNNGTLRTTIAAMSGRIILVLDGTSDSASLRAAMDAAYGGTHVIFIGENNQLPKPMAHPLQSHVRWEDAFEEVKARLFMDGDVDKAYHYLSGSGPRTPISVLASTKSQTSENIYRVESDFLEKVVAGMCDTGCFPITGSGPGDMLAIARAAQKKETMTLGIAFFRTYLAINPHIDIAVIGNLKMERADFMTLSSVATINLGGSHATADEIVSARQFGKPLINCVPEFDVEYFRGIGGRSSSPLLSATTPEETLMMLRGIIK